MTPREWSPRLRAASLLARAIPASFFAFVCITFVQDFLETGRWTSLAWIMSEGLVVVLFILRRPSADVSRRPADWMAAVGGTLFFLLVRPGGHAFVAPAVALTLQFAGMGIQVYGKLALGRSFGAVAANRGVVSGGPYRFVRHPIYTGYLVSHIGFFLANASLLNLSLYLVGYGIQVFRIFAEERLLMADAQYCGYAAHVRYRLIPRVF